MMGRRAHYGRVYPPEADMNLSLGPAEYAPPQASVEAPPPKFVEAGVRD
jgi:hypothetical protein